MLESPPIPAEFVALASDWHDGINCMLYAIASTGDLTMGSMRPHAAGSYRPFTDEEWYWGIWSDLACDIGHAVASARRIDHPDAEALERFEAFASNEADRLEIAYGIDL